MRVFLYSRMVKQEDVKYINQLLNVLNEIKAEICFEDNFLHHYVKAAKPSKQFKALKFYEDLKDFDPDFVITLGGDGTILKAVTIIRDLEIPMLGINLGRLGFLASTEKSFIKEAIKFLDKGMYNIEKRSMLHVETLQDLFGELKFGLNDFTLHKRDTSSMITLHTYINGEFLNSYWADGIIVSTPTGSTGYSLSCGGPIIFPNSGNFVITPVAPHNLTARPIVISDDAVISFEIEGRSNNFLCTIDSRSETISANQRIAVRKCEFVTKLVQLHNMSFMRTIHEKLAWGHDSRN